MLLKREALRWEADLKRKLHDVEERLADEMRKAVRACVRACVRA